MTTPTHCNCADPENCTQPLETKICKRIEAMTTPKKFYTQAERDRALGGAIREAAQERLNREGVQRKLVAAQEALAKAEARAEGYRLALAEIREEWAGAECGEPVTAQEGYAIHLCKRMYQLAVDALTEGK